MQMRLSHLVDPYMLMCSPIPTGIPSNIMDANTERLGFVYRPRTTSPITNIAVLVHVVGSPGPLKVGVFGSDAAALTRPGSTQYGDYTAGFSPADYAWTAWQELLTNTGNLVVGTQYWVVLERSSGTIDGSNLYQSAYRDTSAASAVLRGYATYYTTSWQAPSNGHPLFLVQHADGTIGGALPFTPSTPGTAAPHIFGSNKQGIRFRVGAKLNVVGFSLLLTRAGTPTNLIATLYEGDVQKDQVTVSNQQELRSGNTNVNHIVFGGDYALAADTDCYIIFSQAGILDTDDWALHTQTLTTTPSGLTLANAVPANFAYVAGSAAVPSALTASTTLIPLCIPFWVDSENDIDFDAGGSGSGSGGFVFPPGMWPR